MTTSDLPLGIDVSNHQSYIDWGEVAGSGVRFAFIKASESVTFRDPWFPRNWAESRRHGIFRGAYHYAQPDHNAPEAEARYFYDTVVVQGIERGDILALDLEEGHGDLSSWTVRFLTTLEDIAGYKPILYTSPAFISEHNLSSRSKLSEYGLWLASWSNRFPETPPPWSVVAFWQYSSHGTVPGVNGPCDMNRFNGNVDRVILYGKPGTTGTVEPEPDPDELTVLRRIRGYLSVDVARALRAAIDVRSWREVTAVLEELERHAP